MIILFALIFIWFIEISMLNFGTHQVCPNTLNWAYFGFMNLLFAILIVTQIIRANKYRLEHNGQSTSFRVLASYEWMILIALFLVYQVSFLMHLKIVHDYLIHLSPSFFNRVYDSSFHYSNILSSTLLMTIANISSCMILIFLTWTLLQVPAKPENLLFERISKSKFALWIIIIFAFGFNYLWAVLRHNTFNSKAWDLAIFAQLIHNFRNGVFFEAKVRGVENIFSDHFNPIIYFFSPMLYIWDDPSRLLLLMQALFIAVGAIPVYLLARHKTGSQRTGFLTAASYLCLPALQYMSIFDFHPVVISIPLILFSWYFWEIRRFSLMYLFLALSLLCDEQMWIIVGAIGLLMIFQPENCRRGLIITCIGWGGFLLMVLLVFPFLRQGEAYFYVHRYAYLGDSFSDIIINMITKPWLWIPKLVSLRAISFLILLFMPVGFLALRAPKYLLILIPAYIYSVLSIEPLQTSIFAQYAAPYVPFVMIATVYALAALKEKRSIAVYLFFSALVCNLFFSPLVFSKAYRSQLFITDQEYYKNYLMEIPEDASISSMSRFAPHLIRRDLYLFPDYDDVDYIVLERTERDDPVLKTHFDKIFSVPYMSHRFLSAPVTIVRKFSDDQYSCDPLLLPKTLYNHNDLLLEYPIEHVRFENIDDNQQDMPVILRIGYAVPSSRHSGNLALNFEKLSDTDKRYFGVLIYMLGCDRVLMDIPPNFNLIRFWMGLHSDSDWKIGENFTKIVTSPDLCNINNLSFFILMEIPDDYPNTLDEYFREYVIENRIIFNDYDYLKSRDDFYVQSLKLSKTH